MMMQQPDEDNTSMLGNVQDLVIGAVVLMLGYCAWRFFNSNVAHAVGNTVGNVAKAANWATSSPWAFLITVILGIAAYVLYNLGYESISSRFAEYKESLQKSREARAEAKAEKAKAKAEAKADKAKAKAEAEANKAQPKLVPQSLDVDEAAKDIGKNSIAIDSLMTKNGVTKDLQTSLNLQAKRVVYGNKSMKGTYVLTKDGIKNLPEPESEPDKTAYGKLRAMAESMNERELNLFARYLQHDDAEIRQSVVKNLVLKNVTNPTIRDLYTVQIKSGVPPEDAKLNMRALAQNLAMGVFDDNNILEIPDLPEEPDEIVEEAVSDDETEEAEVETEKSLSARLPTIEEGEEEGEGEEEREEEEPKEVDLR